MKRIFSTVLGGLLFLGACSTEPKAPFDVKDVATAFKSMEKLIGSGADTYEYTATSAEMGDDYSEYVTRVYTWGTSEGDKLASATVQVTEANSTTGVEAQITARYSVYTLTAGTVKLSDLEVDASGAADSDLFDAFSTYTYKETESTGGSAVTPFAITPGVSVYVIKIDGDTLLQTTGSAYDVSGKSITVDVATVAATTKFEAI